MRVFVITSGKALSTAVSDKGAVNILHMVMIRFKSFLECGCKGSFSKNAKILRTAGIALKANTLRKSISSYTRFRSTILQKISSPWNYLPIDFHTQDSTDELNIHQC